MHATDPSVEALLESPGIKKGEYQGIGEWWLHRVNMHDVKGRPAQVSAAKPGPERTMPVRRASATEVLPRRNDCSTAPEVPGRQPGPDGVEACPAP